MSRYEIMPMRYAAADMREVRRYTSPTLYTVVADYLTVTEARALIADLEVANVR